MLHIVRSGRLDSTQPVLVFLHYFGGSHLSWDAVVALLSPTFRCLAIDLPGFGQSAELSNEQTVYQVARAVQATIQAECGPASFVLVGGVQWGVNWLWLLPQVR